VKLRTRIAFLLLLAAILPRCSTAHATHTLGEPVSIRLEKSADFDGGLRITFTSLVKDSRCPKGVTCIQAGEAVVELTGSSRKDESGIVRVSSARSKNRVEVAGFIVELLDVSSNEHGGKTVVTLRVTAR
jgi:hypothetical protein